MEVDSLLPEFYIYIIKGVVIQPLRFKKTVGLLSLDLKAIMYDCSSILSYTFYLTSKYTIMKIMEEA
ncbi:putative clathrin heavy chain [Frankliniella fusca]|uniref:Clathrin heavy chain n=1 Tax=Frankliniella fusca TaxID=407009 RepID=A0AAE1LED4_9NEOP|nr:putative clathrin heavy chain [Frankliniella fusca]